MENTEGISLDGLLDSLGVNTPPPAGDNSPPDDGNTPLPDEGTPPPDDSGTPSPDAGAAGEGEQGEQGEQGGQQNPPLEPKADKRASAAFAQMRVQNKKYETMFKSLASVLGVQDTSDPDKLIKALNGKLVEAQAKQQNIPVDVLQRLQKLEEENQTYTAEQLKRTAYIGFQKVKDEHQLSDAELNSFADSLIADGLNPFEQPVDLLAEYRLRNFEKLLKAAEARGVKQEMERAAKAAAQSSTPNSGAGGKGEGQEGKITTISALDKFFADNLQK